MGDYNSSVTRVWPVFEYLLQKDVSGRTWLAPLLNEVVGHPRFETDQIGSLWAKTTERTRAIPGAMDKVLTPAQRQRLGMLRWAYERDLEPTESFLRWLIEHPGELSWPVEKS